MLGVCIRCQMRTCACREMNRYVWYPWHNNALVSVKSYRRHIYSRGAGRGRGELGQVQWASGSITPITYRRCRCSPLRVYSVHTQRAIQLPLAPYEANLAETDCDYVPWRLRPASAYAPRCSTGASCASDLLTTTLINVKHSLMVIKDWSPFES